MRVVKIVSFVIILFCTAQQSRSQNVQCDFYLDTLESDVIDYLLVDSSLLVGQNFVLLLEILNGNKRYYKFEDSSDYLIATKQSLFTSNKTVLRANLTAIQHTSGKLYFADSRPLSHHFSMLVVKKDGNYFEIIPYGSNLNSILNCVQVADSTLFILVQDILKLKITLDKQFPEPIPIYSKKPKLFASMKRKNNKPQAPAK
ncbi:MAG: hypothetical protein RL660_41 [Bacteroidota bacterium]|jgi:hypothetical protein